jgi:septal ring factor EnvC (AmiA/AmiB activator)
MPSRKINDRNFFKRKKDLLNFVDSLSFAMRLYKRCSSLRKTCTLDEMSKKCICYVKTNKSCDLAISSAKLRRIHKKRLRVRDAIHEMKTKLYRLKHQLQQLENKKKKIMLSK